MIRNAWSGRLLPLLLIVSCVTLVTESVLAPPPGGPPNQKGNLDILVVDTDGNPLAGMTVQVYADGGAYIDWVVEGITNADGEILFKKLLAGDYSILAVGLLFPPVQGCGGTASATVLPKQTTEVTVVATCG